MENIPAYANHGTTINPKFIERTLDMLSGFFGYDRLALETALMMMQESYEWNEFGNDVKAFTDFLFCAIEGDLDIEPVEK